MPMRAAGSPWRRRDASPVQRNCRVPFRARLRAQSETVRPRVVRATAFADRSCAASSSSPCSNVAASASRSHSCTGMFRSTVGSPRAAGRAGPSLIAGDTGVACEADQHDGPGTCIARKRTHRLMPARCERAVRASMRPCQTLMSIGSCDRTQRPAYQAAQTGRGTVCSVAADPARVPATPRCRAPECDRLHRTRSSRARRDALVAVAAMSSSGRWKSMPCAAASNSMPMIVAVFIAISCNRRAAKVDMLTWSS